MVQYNYKYYYLETKEVRPTVTEIPKDMWEKKGLLPYEVVNIDIPDTEPLPKDKVEVLTNKVIETKYKHIHIDTLDEHKTKKIQLLKSNTLMYTLEIYPQYKRDLIFATLNGLQNTGYTIQEATNISNWILQHRVEVNLIEQNILNCVSKDEVDTYPDSIELGVV